MKATHPLVGKAFSIHSEKNMEGGGPHGSDSTFGLLIVARTSGSRRPDLDRGVKPEHHQQPTFERAPWRTKTPGSSSASTGIEKYETSGVVPKSRRYVAPSRFGIERSKLPVSQRVPRLRASGVIDTTPAKGRQLATTLQRALLTPMPLPPAGETRALDTLLLRIGEAQQSAVRCGGRHSIARSWTGQKRTQLGSKRHL